MKDFLNQIQRISLALRHLFYVFIKDHLVNYQISFLFKFRDYVYFSHNFDNFLVFIYIDENVLHVISKTNHV